MLTSDVVLLLDNARPLIAPRTRALPDDKLGVVWPSSLQPWTRFERLPPVYLSEELVGFTALQQQRIVDGRYQNVAELTGVQTLIPRHDMCLNSGGDYVKK
jgi:hypothetical protein